MNINAQFYTKRRPRVFVASAFVFVRLYGFLYWETIFTHLIKHGTDGSDDMTTIVILKLHGGTLQ